ncbi:Fe-S-containing protein, partial [Anaerospora hongkongensis]|uniref:Fe-S-containing protein n=1 Tax=Anaerospora hongkongensis TaxID=244830 RepID=UPI002FD9F878
NYQTWFLYALLIVTLALVAILYKGRKATKRDDLNPAQYRKVLITVRKQLNWGTVVAVNLMLVFVLSTAGKAYADQKVEITPAVPVAAVQGAISIPLEKVSDGRLHRFSFRASNGTTMRFIIIKKSGSAYGVGLDACDICGPTGYYEREDQVVCKLCDVVMNKATIGFKGGCNPVPLEYRMTAGKLVIPAAALEIEKGRFK